MAIESIQNDKPPADARVTLPEPSDSVRYAPSIQGGYFNFVHAAYAHGMLLMMRRQRLVVAVVILIVPIIIPLALAMFSTAQFADDGNARFIYIAEQLYINIMAPLVALFFAAMLIAEEAETLTMPYILTRPVPRSAWVFGRFLAYLLLGSTILTMAIIFAFCACTTLSNLGFGAADLRLLAHYAAVGIIALIAYGSAAMFLAAAVKRPMIIGVVFFYAWQKVATLVPGLIDFFTIQKYTTAILPALATERTKVEVMTVFGEYQKEIFAVNAGKALLVLACITVTFLTLTVLFIRLRQFAASKTVGN
jgi:ABC-type transport system involved in multi-copper enzyme maturation permease subunit